MQPSLAFSYSSGAGNGALGVGFELSTGFPRSISRGRSILARDGFVRGVALDSADKLYLDGKRLICVEGSYGAPGSVYRTEVDSFVTITASGTGQDSSNWNIESFLLTDKDGRRFVFGKIGLAADGYHSGVGGSNTAAYEWALKRVSDLLGNFIEFSYVGNGAGLFLLENIYYTGGPGIATKTRVQMTYGDRPDSSIKYQAKKSIKHDKRLVSVSVHAATDGGELLAGLYALTYDSSSAAAVSRIHKISASFRDSAGVMRNLPDTSIEWEDRNIGLSNSTIVVNSPNNSAQFGAAMDWGDLDGDGDDEPVFQPDTYSGISPRLADVDGDGIKDQVTLNFPDWVGASSISVALSGGGVARIDNQFFKDLFKDPGAGWNELIKREGEGVTSRVTFADFNGDGRDDLLVHSYDDRLYLYTSIGSGFAAPIASAVVGGGGSVLNVQTYHQMMTGIINNYVDKHYFIRPIPCDLNGDGRSDYVFIQNSRSYSYDGVNVGAYSNFNRAIIGVLSLPSGGFSAPFNVGNQLRHTAGYGSSPTMSMDEVYSGVLPGDFNGDGMTDFLVLGSYTNYQSHRWVMIISKGGVDDYSYETIFKPMPDTVTHAGE